MSDHAPPTAPAEGAAPASGIKAKLPMILAVIVGLTVGAGSGAVVVGPMVAKKMGFVAKAVPPPAVEGEHASATGEAAKGEPAAGEHGEKGSESEKPPVLLLENLVLNPASSGGSRYLLMSIAIESADAKSVAALTLRDAELKDLILTTLSKKTVDELSDVGGREAIKTELLTAIAERFGKSSVKQLYFPQFVIQ